MKKTVHRMSQVCFQPSLGLLLVRIAAGVVFVRHGWLKFGSLPMTEHFFGMLGLPLWTAPFVAFVEVVGGLMLIFGILTRVAGAALAIDMVVAIFITGFGHGWAPHEFEFVLFAIAGGVGLGGTGKYGLYPMECRDCGGMVCNGTCKA